MYPVKEKILLIIDVVSKENVLLLNNHAGQMVKVVVYWQEGRGGVPTGFQMKVKI